MIENRLTESKLEQQHIMTICNLMGPIIHALNTGVQKVPPRSFQELIAQLDEINRQIKNGSLMTTQSIQQLKNELLQSRTENEAMRIEIETQQDSYDQLNRQYLKREAEWVHYYHTMNEELKELRGYKAQVTTWCMDEQQAEFEAIPSFLRILAAEDQINELQYLETALQGQQLHLQTEQTDNLIPISQQRQDSHQNPFVQKILQTQSNVQQRRLENTGGASARNLTPQYPPGGYGVSQTLGEDGQQARKTHQQTITLNNVKGLHAHQQQSAEGGAGVDDGKRSGDDRKASFSPSIFVRKYLPFFK